MDTKCMVCGEKTSVNYYDGNSVTVKSKSGTIVGRVHFWCKIDNERFETVRIDDNNFTTTEVMP